MAMEASIVDSAQVGDFRRNLLMGNGKTTLVHEGIEAVQELLDLLLLGFGARVQAFLLATCSGGCLPLGQALVGCDFLLSRLANRSLKLSPKPIAKLSVDVNHSLQSLQTEFQILLGSPWIVSNCPPGGGQAAFNFRSQFSGDDEPFFLQRPLAGRRRLQQRRRLPIHRIKKERSSQTSEQDRKGT